MYMSDTCSVSVHHNPGLALFRFSSKPCPLCVGRMLMKGKYQELEPLLQKINRASTERRTVELELKQQLKRVEQLRTSLAGSLAKFSGLVEELSATKAMIDARLVVAKKSWWG